MKREHDQPQNTFFERRTSRPIFAPDFSPDERGVSA
jgi:hypothetical protein